MRNVRILPRLIADTIDRHLQIMPAVVLTGARQTGKSTLAETISPVRRRLVSLDNLDMIDAARRDPSSLVGDGRPLTIDEVQREPSLLLAVKQEIDRRRQPGQFLLTGSANLLLMRTVSESLAGRATYLTLWPMTRREQLGLGSCGAWGELLAARSEDWLDLLRARPEIPEDWQALARRGGFPVPAVRFKTARARSVWFDGYVQTYLERDLLNLSQIAALPDFRRLMRASSLRLGSIVNQTELGRDVALPQPTVRRYLNLLETSYLLVRLPAYAVNRTKRLIKSPKLYWCDTGLALHLSGAREPSGVHLENLVLQDLLAWASLRTGRPEIFYWRTTTGEEVDLVIEVGDRLLPIEVKATRRPRFRDARNLLAFRNEYGKRVLPGLVLHAGDASEWIAPNALAVPWWKVL